jgi:YggT family protein
MSRIWEARKTSGRGSPALPDMMAVVAIGCAAEGTGGRPPGKITACGYGKWPGTGDVMQILKVVLTYVLELYLVVLIGTMILSWINMFVRPWYPPRVVKLLAETIFTLTDPPLKFLRRYIPPLRLGTVSLDLSFMVLFIVVLILLQVAVPRL